MRQSGDHREAATDGHTRRHATDAPEQMPGTPEGVGPQNFESTDLAVKKNRLSRV
jgi:hypothetical protein